MTEESAQKDHEEEALQGLQNENVSLLAQAGEAQYIISVKRKELAKFNIRLRKLNQKAHALMQNIRLRKEAQSKKPALQAVPSAEEVSA